MEEVSVSLKDDRKVIFRQARVEDAKACIAFMQSVYSESEYLTRYPDEFVCSEEIEKARIARFDFIRSGTFVLEEAGQIIGNVSIREIGRQDKVKHRCLLGISILKAYWSQGLGKFLMQRAIDFATQVGYEQIELEVVTENFRGVPLYTSYGFEIYGTRPRAFKLRDGRYMDEYLMVKKLR